jgi:hypothetical protein
VALTSHELALRYLLELSSDIRLALLWEREGEPPASSAPAASGARVAELGRELAQAADASFAARNGSALELDIGCEDGAVFLIREGDTTMLCLTERSVLPGLIFYDMHAVLRDLDRAAQAEGRRSASA